MCYYIYTTEGNTPNEKELNKMFEAQLLNGLKEEFNITTNHYNKSIKILIKQYIKGEINKQGLTDILVGFSKEK